MKTYTKTVISESEYKHIQHLHTNIYRVMVKESQQDGMLTVATAKYDHEPTEDEIMADYNASVEAVSRMAVQQAQRQKIREIDAYNDSDSVNGFYINKQKVWVDAETRVKGVNGAKAKQTLNVLLSFGVIRFRQQAEDGLLFLSGGVKHNGMIKHYIYAKIYARRSFMLIAWMKTQMNNSLILSCCQVNSSSTSSSYPRRMGICALDFRSGMNTGLNQLE